MKAVVISLALQDLWHALCSVWAYRTFRRVPPDGYTFDVNAELGCVDIYAPGGVAPMLWQPDMPWGSCPSDVEHIPALHHAKHLLEQASGRSLYDVAVFHRI